MTTEQEQLDQLRVEIDRLRNQFPDTQELYREVCVLLFFRHGITPTANKLYQLVHKGSMSAPAEALRQFWADLREKSRIRIEHPDLPESLKEDAAALMASIWSKAQDAAHVGLESFYAQSQEQVQNAQNLLTQVEDERNSATESLARTTQSLQDALGRIQELGRGIASTQANNEALMARLEAADKQRTDLEAALVSSRQDFASELGKLRNALEKSEYRCSEAEKRALLEIDHARTAASKLQKELNQSRNMLQAANENHQREIVQLQQKLTETHLKIGMSEGATHELREANLRLLGDLEAARKEMANQEIQNSLLAREVSEKTQALLQSELRSKMTIKKQTRSAVSKDKKRF